MNTINAKNFLNQYYNSSTQTKTSQKNSQSQSGAWSNQAATYEHSEISNQTTYQRSYVAARKTTQSQNTQNGVELSKGAQDVLKQLQEKYGNTSFLVGSYETDEEAQSILSNHVTDKEYSVLIDPETLERMAKDQSEMDKVMGTLEDAFKSLSDIKDQLGDDASKVKSVGISIDKDGKVSFFAEMQKASEKQQKALEERRAERKEKEKAEEKAAEKKKESQEQSHRIFADSIEDLLAKIHDYSADKTGKEEENA